MVLTAEIEEMDGYWLTKTVQIVLRNLPGHHCSRCGQICCSN